MRFEHQFIGGLSGQQILIFVGDMNVADFNAETQFQTGLAHIEPLDLPTGKAVIVKVDGRKFESRFYVDAALPFIVFRLAGDTHSFAMTDQPPGYL